MLFNSLPFIVFFGIVFCGYYFLPHRFRWLLLLASSCYFYMAFVPWYILIFFVLIIVDFFLAKLIEQSAGRTRKLYLLVSILFNIGTLFTFKYFNFFNANLAELAHFLGWNYSIKSLNLILPLGLSFHTFQSLSYIVEVYRGRYAAERKLGIYALYVMFFPQLVSGPIERPFNLLPQLHAEHNFDYVKVSSGFKLMLWGFFKKLVIADHLSVLVDRIFGQFGAFSGPILLLGAVAFAFQLYCDFSGYTDIARGAARTLGVNLMKNFDRPFASRSIAEFWRHWHISLSTWFRDYVYIPLGGNRVSKPRHYFNLFISFLVSGLWHGANWTFIVWGAINGIYLICGIVFRQLREKLAHICGLSKKPRVRGAIQIVLTFLLTSLALVFFRAPSITDALSYLQRLFLGWGQLFDVAFLRYQVFIERTIGLDKPQLLLVIFSLILMEVIQLLQKHGGLLGRIGRQPLWIRWSIYYALIFWILAFGVFESKSFIYFQF